jgi:uncharacterized Zn finger protein
MSRYDRYRYGYSRFPEYVPVAARKAKAAATAAKLAKGKTALSPVVLAGHKIADTFWGKAWCKNIESYQDFENRLPRGRSYVRGGAVIDLQIAKGEVTALVCGSSRTPYKIKIAIAPLARPRWEAIKRRCLGKIGSLVSLIQGKLSQETLALLCDRESGIFPAPSEIEMDCSCPDWADLCKHLAAVLYGIGARLDADPSLFFVLRGVDQNELISAEVVDALTADVASEIDESQLENVFGVDFDTSATPAVAESAPTPATEPDAASNPLGKTKRAARKKATPEKTPPAAQAKTSRKKSSPAAAANAKAKAKGKPAHDRSVAEVRKMPGADRAK